MIREVEELFKDLGTDQSQPLGQFKLRLYFCLRAKGDRDMPAVRGTRPPAESLSDI
jgi:hypothetical protein